MISFTNRLLEPKPNGEEIVKIASNLLNINISSLSIRERLEQHPDYPSLLSISDIMLSFGIENLSFSIDKEKILDIGSPFVTQIKGSQNDQIYFTVVKNISNNQVHYYDPEFSRWFTISIQRFLEKSTNIVLLFDAKEGAGDQLYAQNEIKERRDKTSLIIKLLWFPCIIITAGFLYVRQYGVVAVLPIFYLFLNLFGGIVSTLLLFYEIDKSNPLLKQLCGLSKKVNCAAVLSSKSATILGVSWSSIGFAYFWGLAVLQLMAGIVMPHNLALMGWISLFASSYIFYSLYYQYFVTKHWCSLCLIVQCILLIQLFITSVDSWRTLHSFSNLYDFFLILNSFIAFGIPLMGASLFIPMLKKAKSSRIFFTSLQRLKHTPEVFYALLNKQAKAVAIPEDLGIQLGSTNATIKIVKVCNPYCKPCADAHPSLEEILDNNSDVALQIIFTASNSEHDPLSKPVKHFLSIQEEHGEKATKEVLNEWYSNGKENYNDFVAKYPINNICADHNIEIEEMYNWCLYAEIAATPTLFISMESTSANSRIFYKLPDFYNITDLKYFLSV